MKVLVIGALPRSLVNFRGHLLKEMVDGGHSVWACANGKDVFVENEMRAIGVNYCPISINRTGVNIFADLITFLHLVRLIHLVKPQYVLSYTVKPVVYGGMAAALCRTSRIYSMVTGLGYAFMAFQSSKQHLLNSMVKFLYKISLRYSHKVFFQNPDDIELFVKLGIINSKKAIILNGSGVDLKHYAPAPLPGDPVFVLIARLLSDKGIREYVEAARHVKKVFPEARFCLAGDFDSNPSGITSRELQEWQAINLIEYLGYLEDIRPVIASSRVYVLPSYREGTPRTILEAMSMGRAIITTDVPGCRETVMDGANGFLVPVKSIESLQKAILKFIEDPHLAVQMGECSRRIAEEKYDVHKVNEVILNEMGLV